MLQAPRKREWTSPQQGPMASRWILFGATSLRGRPRSAFAGLQHPGAAGRRNGHRRLARLVRLGRAGLVEDRRCRDRVVPVRGAVTVEHGGGAEPVERLRRPIRPLRPPGPGRRAPCSVLPGTPAWLPFTSASGSRRGRAQAPPLPPDGTGPWSAPCASWSTPVGQATTTKNQPCPCPPRRGGHPAPAAGRRLRRPGRPGRRAARRPSRTPSGTGRVRPAGTSGPCGARAAGGPRRRRRCGSAGPWEHGGRPP